MQVLDKYCVSEHVGPVVEAVHRHCCPDCWHLHIFPMFQHGGYERDKCSAGDVI